VFDYGDFNPRLAPSQRIVLEGSSVSGSSSDALDFETEQKEFPRGPRRDFLRAGDACDAIEDTKNDPGYAKLEVTEPAMTRVTLRVTAGRDPNVGFDSISFTRDDIEIDIKPNSDPNCFNINGSGVVPVAINGRSDFDVMDIDPATFSFAGLDVRVKNNGNIQCNQEDWNRDGFTDLVCQFEDDPSFWSPGEGSATLTGNFLDGTPFESSDSICIRNGS
jgi:hypothetical protein